MNLITSLAIAVTFTDAKNQCKLLHFIRSNFPNCCAVWRDSVTDIIYFVFVSSFVVVVVVDAIVDIFHWTPTKWIILTHNKTFSIFRFPCNAYIFMFSAYFSRWNDEETEILITVGSTNDLLNISYFDAFCFFASSISTLASNKMNKIKREKKKKTLNSNETKMCQTNGTMCKRNEEKK